VAGAAAGLTVASRPAPRTRLDRGPDRADTRRLPVSDRLDNPGDNDRLPTFAMRTSLPAQRDRVPDQPGRRADRPDRPPDRAVAARGRRLPSRGLRAPRHPARRNVVRDRAVRRGRHLVPSVPATVRDHLAPNRRDQSRLGQVRGRHEPPVRARHRGGPDHHGPEQDHRGRAVHPQVREEPRAARPCQARRRPDHLDRHPEDQPDLYPDPGLAHQALTQSHWRQTGRNAYLVSIDPDQPATLLVAAVFQSRGDDIRDCVLCP
jgi:hypothetical protein